MTEPKELCFDIESSHDILAKFGLREEYTHHENILQDWSIISAAWGWRNQKGIHGVCVTKFGSDKEVCKSLAAAIAEADVIIGHNSDSFDVKKLRTRLFYHRLPDIKNVRQIDTKKVAKNRMAFSSNAMDYIARYAGEPRKKKVENELWLRCLRDDKTAFREMLEYNKQDIVVLKKVADRLEDYAAEPFINKSLFYQDNGICPKCSSDNWKFDGHRYLTTGKFTLYRCLDCFKQWRSTTACARVKIK